jgi:hypothetical protein
MDEITELTNLDPDSVDGVMDGMPANGITEWIVAKASSPVAKRDYTVEERRKLAAEGKAIPSKSAGGKFPIVDKEDLENAIRTIGLTNEPKEKVRAYIIRRAKALGAMDKIPKKWRKMSKTQKSIGSVGDGRGMLDIDMMVSKFQEGLQAIQASVAALKDEKQLGTGTPTDPDPVVEKMAELTALVKQAVDQTTIDQERAEASDTVAGDAEKAKKDKKLKAKCKKLQKELKKAKAKKVSKAVHMPLTNGLAAALGQESNTSVTPAEIVRKKTADLEPTERARVTRSATREALADILGPMLAAPPTEILRGGRS